MQSILVCAMDRHPQSSFFLLPLHPIPPHLQVIFSVDMRVGVLYLPSHSISNGVPRGRVVWMPLDRLPARQARFGRGRTAVVNTRLDRVYVRGGPPQAERPRRLPRGSILCFDRVDHHYQEFALSPALCSVVLDLAWHPQMSRQGKQA